MQMTKKEMAEWLATISSKLNKSKSFEEWVNHYLTFSESELAEDIKSYGC